MTAERYWLFIWACMFGLFISDVLMLFFVYQRLSAVWLRVLGCGTV